jgi:hypothetical protein
VEREDPFAERVEAAASGLEHEERLRGVLDLPLPAVDRAEPGHDVAAGDESLLDEGARDRGRALRVWRGDQHDQRFRSIHAPTSHLTEPP